VARQRPVGDVEPTSPTGSNRRQRAALPALPDDIAADPEADAETAARTICLRLLTARDRTRFELATALEDRNVPADAAARVLDRLEAVGLIDDLAFSESFTQSRHGERGLARREIARQLRAKGVDEATVRSAMDRIDLGAERLAAIRLVQRRVRSMNGLDSATKARRLAGMLARKGYSPALSYSVVKDVLADCGGATELPEGLDTA
jgi:regulatory protein